MLAPNELHRLQQNVAGEAVMRSRRAADMANLTVNELTNLMKARKLTIGSRKRKTDLIEQLLVHSRCLISWSVLQVWTCSNNGSKECSKQ